MAVFRKLFTRSLPAGPIDGKPIKPSRATGAGRSEGYWPERCRQSLKAAALKSIRGRERVGGWQAAAATVGVGREDSQYFNEATPPPINSQFSTFLPFTSVHPIPPLSLSFSLSPSPAFSLSLFLSLSLIHSPHLRLARVLLGASASSRTALRALEKVRTRPNGVIDAREIDERMLPSGDAVLFATRPSRTAILLPGNRRNRQTSSAKRQTQPGRPSCRFRLRLPRPEVPGVQRASSTPTDNGVDSLAQDCQAALDQLPGGGRKTVRTKPKAAEHREHCQDRPLRRRYTAQRKGFIGGIRTTIGGVTAEARSNGGLCIDTGVAATPQSFVESTRRCRVRPRIGAGCGARAGGEQLFMTERAFLAGRRCAGFLRGKKHEDPETRWDSRLGDVSPPWDAAVFAA